MEEIKFKYYLILKTNKKVLKEYVFNLKEIEEGKSNFALTSNVELKRVQYIGRVDIDNVEIFNNDIIIYQHEKYDKEPQIGLIEYSNINSAYTINGKYFSSIDTAINTIKVIGNIYNNPELLKKIKNK